MIMMITVKMMIVIGVETILVVIENNDNSAFYDYRDRDI